MQFLRHPPSEESSEMAILVMLNNYFHDLATAVFAVAAVAAWRLEGALGPGGLTADLRARVVDPLLKVGYGAFAWTLLAGVPRALAFRRYEWMEAAGRAQVPALMVKHVVLVALVVLGLVTLGRLRRRRTNLEVAA